MKQCMESFKYSVKIESSYFAAGTKDLKENPKISKVALAKKYGVDRGTIAKAINFINSTCVQSN
jgi:predicted regulator of amino acid metabolism with ACT domain